MKILNKISYIKNNVKYFVRFIIPMGLFSYTSLDPLIRTIATKKHITDELKKDEQA